MLRPVVDERGPVLDPDTGAQVTYELALSEQRFSYCVQHSSALGLATVLCRGHLEQGEGNPLPDSHALVGSRVWVLDG